MEKDVTEEQMGACDIQRELTDLGAREKETYAKLELQDGANPQEIQTVFVKGAWYPDHFFLSVLDGRDTWTLSASEEYVARAASDWDMEVGEWLDKVQTCFSQQDPKNSYSFIPAGADTKMLQCSLYNEEWYERRVLKLLLERTARPAAVAFDILEFLADTNTKQEDELARREREIHRMAAEIRQLRQDPEELTKTGRHSYHAGTHDQTGFVMANQASQGPRKTRSTWTNSSVTSSRSQSPVTQRGGYPTQPTDHAAEQRRQQSVGEKSEANVIISVHSTEQRDDQPDPEAETGWPQLESHESVPHHNEASPGLGVRWGKNRAYSSRPLSWSVPKGPSAASGSRGAYSYSAPFYSRREDNNREAAMLERENESGRGSYQPPARVVTEGQVMMETPSGGEDEARSEQAPQCSCRQSRAESYSLEAPMLDYEIQSQYTTPAGSLMDAETLKMQNEFQSRRSSAAMDYGMQSPYSTPAGSFMDVETGMTQSNHQSRRSSQASGGRSVAEMMNKSMENETQARVQSYYESLRQSMAEGNPDNKGKEATEYNSQSRAISYRTPKHSVAGEKSEHKDRMPPGNDFATEEPSRWEMEDPVHQAAMRKYSEMMGDTHLPTTKETTYERGSHVHADYDRGAPYQEPGQYRVSEVTANTGNVDHPSASYVPCCTPKRSTVEAPVERMSPHTPTFDSELSSRGPSHAGTRYAMADAESLRNEDSTSYSAGRQKHISHRTPKHSVKEALTDRTREEAFASEFESEVRKELYRTAPADRNMETSWVDDTQVNRTPSPEAGYHSRRPSRTLPRSAMASLRISHAQRQLQEQDLHPATRDEQREWETQNLSSSIGEALERTAPAYIFDDTPGLFQRPDEGELVGRAVCEMDLYDQNQGMASRTTSYFTPVLQYDNPTVVCRATDSSRRLSFNEPQVENQSAAALSRVSSYAQRRTEPQHSYSGTELQRSGLDKSASSSRRPSLPKLNNEDRPTTGKSPQSRSPRSPRSPSVITLEVQSKVHKETLEKFLAGGWDSVTLQIPAINDPEIRSLLQGFIGKSVTSPNTQATDSGQSMVNRSGERLETNTQAVLSNSQQYAASLSPSGSRTPSGARTPSSPRSPQSSEKKLSAGLRLNGEGMAGVECRRQEPKKVRRDKWET